MEWSRKVEMAGRGVHPQLGYRLDVAWTQRPPDGGTSKIPALSYKLDGLPSDDVRRPAYRLGPKAKMGRSNHIVALTSAVLVLLIAFPLIATFGLPTFDWSGLSIFSSDKWQAQSAFGGLGSHLEMLRASDPDQFLIGVGKADITGPVVELNLMGYANSSQIGTGLRQRLYSRAFIIGSITNPSDRFVYLVLDTQSGDTAIRYGILSGLDALGPGYVMYGQKNVAVTGTHSHAGPGAWLNYLLPQITSLGFDQQSYKAIVDGTVLSIKRAHESLAPGYLTFGSTTLDDANISRSPYAYLANPASERAMYTSDVDKTMTMLRFKRASDSKNIGVLTWFPVHGTSLLGNNTIVAADNKGVAARLFEQQIGGGIISGFSQSNVGDTSPNINGAWCEDGSNQMCDFKDSTCGNKSQPCHGRGPFNAQFDNGAKSCFAIGQRQATAAMNIFNSLDTTGTPIKGGAVKSIHSFNDMSNFNFTLSNGTLVHTCPAALGYSFAAGTTDGPGAFDFKQNDSGAPNANPVWSVVSGILKAPSEKQKACHWPKPILLDVGEISTPYSWTPNIVDIQLLRAGQLIFIVAPGESTTMSGRRWKAAVAAASASIMDSGSSPLVVLGGPANTYSHYIATEEEYGIQRYEGASTLYGPHTLNAYINLSTKYVPFLSSSATGAPPPGPLPENNVNRSMNFITGVVWDSPPIGKKFGQVNTDALQSYKAGQTVMVKFVGANPRNNLRLEGTYVAVEKQNADGTWTQVRDDSDWSTIYNWKRLDGLLGSSEVTIVWEIEADAIAGTYRIKYYGDSKSAFGGRITAFTGTSRTFTVA